MIHDLTKRLKKIDTGNDISNYRWDNGTYLRLDINKTFKEQIGNTENMFSVGTIDANKINPTDLHKTELIEYFYKRDNKTKILNKDYNKTIDSNKKRFWTRTPAYLNIKTINYQKEDTLEGFEKEVFPYFVEPKSYLEKVESSKLFGEIDKKLLKRKTKEEIIKERFQKFAQKEFEYLESDYRKETNEKIVNYIRENLSDIKDYFDNKEMTKKESDSWFIIAINFGDDVSELSHYQNESDLYMLLKQFINNNYNYLDEKEKTVLGAPNFLFNDNDDKITLRTKTQKTDAAILISSEESKTRADMYNFLEKNKYRFKTIKYNNKLTEGLGHGIQMKYTDDGFVYLENNPIIQPKRIEIETEKFRLLPYSENKKYSNHNLIGNLSNKFYNRYYMEDKEMQFNLLEERDRAINSNKMKNKLDEMFINHNVKLLSAFEKNNKSAMEFVIKRNLVDALLQNAIYGFNSGYHKTENERKNYQSKTYRAINLLIALEKELLGEESTMEKLLKEDNKNRLNTEKKIEEKNNDRKENEKEEKFVIEIPKINTKEEYYYYMGQLAHYINSKKETSNKKETRIVEKLPNFKKNEDLINEIISSMFSVKTKLGLKTKSNTRSRAFSELMEKILKFEQVSEELTREDKKHFLLGMLVKNMFFEVKEDEFKKKGDELNGED